MTPYEVLMLVIIVFVLGLFCGASLILNSVKRHARNGFIEFDGDVFRCKKIEPSDIDRAQQ